MPLGRRSRHADDRDAAGPLPLRRHSLVLDHVRPRRADHRDRDAVVRSRHGARRAAPARGVPGQGDRSASRTPSRERSCTRCAPAKWRRSARCRSGSITAAWIRRRCSCCSPASMSSAPATTRCCASCGPRSRRRSPGSTDRAIADRRRLRRVLPQDRQGPRQPGLEGFARCDLPCRRPLRRKARSRSPKCRATSLPPSRSRRAARGGSVTTELASKLEADAARGSPSVSRRRSGVPEIETYALALDGAKEPCAVRTSNAGQMLFTGIARPERASLVADGLLEPALLLRLGHPHRGARRGALQSDVVSQRLDLAARQRADRARLCALRPQSRGRSGLAEACSTPRPTWTCAGCRSCSAGSSASAGAARRSIRWPARRRPGRARRRSR